MSRSQVASSFQPTSNHQLTIISLITKKTKDMCFYICIASHLIVTYIRQAKPAGHGVEISETDRDDRW